MRQSRNINIIVDAGGNRLVLINDILFKGKVEDNEFLVYINAQTGKEEDILLIVNTPDGTLTH